jgi:hypothetical protein
MRVIKIGKVGVDSGNLVIMDPGMAISLQYADTYVNPPIHGVAKKIEFPSAVVAASGHGDGDYPVFALYDAEGDYVGLVISFYPDDAGFTLGEVKNLKAKFKIPPIE